MKNNTKAILLSLIATGLVVGVVVGLKKQKNKNKISSLYIGDIRDYKEFFDGREKCQYGGTMLL